MAAEPTESDLFRSAVIRSHQSKMKANREEWTAYAKAYRSEFFAEGTEAESKNGSDAEMLTVEANWLHPFVETMVANICPTNPQTTVRPRRKDNAANARMQQALINDCLIRDKAYKKLWRLAGRAALYDRMFLKMVWDTRRKRPTARVINPEAIFFDDTVDDFEDIRYLVEVTPLTLAQFKKRLGKKGKRGVNYRPMADEDIPTQPFPEWLRTDNEKSDPQVVSADNFKWVIVYEYYDFVEGKMYHLLEDDPLPLVAGPLPYWHMPCPYFMLTFNDNLQDIGGISDAKLVMPNIKVLNELATLQLWHILATIPRPVVNEALLDEPDEFYTALQNASTPLDAIPFRARSNAGINDVLGHTPTPSLPVDFERAMARVQGLIEYGLGIASYQRGELGASDVATELALSDTAIKTRNAIRQKGIYEAIEWWGQACLALFAQFLDEDEVQAIPLRMGMDDEMDEATRESLGFPPLPSQGEEPAPMDMYGFDYVARPYNAQEQNSIAQLKTLQDYAELLLQSPDVNARRLMQKLLELIHMEEVLASPDEAKQAMQALAGGGGDPEADAAAQGVPNDAAAPLVGGQVEIGGGAQAVASGMKGGPQPGGRTI